MENVVVMTIALQPDANAQAFETCFRERVQMIRAQKRVSEGVTFSLYRPAEAGPEFVWITRFPEEELGRVNRADWPFVVLAMLDMLRDIQRRFADNVSVVSASALTTEGLMEQWNERHGRFAKISLDS